VKLGMGVLELPRVTAQTMTAMTAIAATARLP
jgi:hypothetical protein